MRHRIAILAVLAWMGHAAPVCAQTYTAGADLFFYGDNTEFTNQFRSGETTLGISGRIFLDVELNDTVSVRGGAFALGRFGSHDAFEHAEPAVALQLTRGRSRFIFGSLETVTARHDVRGPDEETPHRLLPPLQHEQLSFTRGQEMGLQWLVASTRLEHDAWINWQRLNTATQRERFDAGYRSALALSSSWQLHGQWHVVHEGGQRFSTGAVGDSLGGAMGVQWTPSHSSTGTRLDVEAHLTGTRDTPDRSRARGTEAGVGLFTRGSIERGPWRSHLIVWRSRDTVKAEGDSNYLSRRRDGSAFRKVRDLRRVGGDTSFPACTRSAHVCRSAHSSSGVQL
jgi:hypothetical protein